MDEIPLGQYRPMVYRFLLFLLRDREDAEEIAQETFRVAISKGHDAEKGTNYGAWLRSIARNLARNHVRKRSRRPLLLHGDVLAAAERRFVETGADQEDLWEARRQALAGCMQQLLDQDADLLRRRYELGEQVKQMARDLGMAPNSLSKKLERIREALRKCVHAALKGVSSE